MEHDTNYNTTKTTIWGMAMKKYLVTMELTEQPYAWNETKREQLPPNARVLTRAQIIAVRNRLSGETDYNGGVPLSHILDELFTETRHD